MATFISNVNTGKLRSTSVTGGTGVTINAGDSTKIDFDVQGYVIDPNTGDRTDVSCTLTAQSIPNIATQIETYVIIGSTGVPEYLDEPPTTEQMSTHLTHWVVVHADFTTVQFVNNLEWNSEQLGDQVVQQWEVFRYLKSGLNLAAGTGGLKFTRQAGVLFRKGIGTSKTEKNTRSYLDAVDTDFQYRLSDGTQLPATTDINTQLLESPLGTQAVVPNNKFTAQAIFMFPSGQIRIQPGQTVYDTLGEAIDGTNTDPFTLEDNIRDNGIQLGWLIVKKGTVNLSNASNAKFINSGLTGGGGSAVVSPTMQNSYDVSVQPQVTTSAVKGSVQYRSYDNTSRIQEWLDSNDNIKLSIDAAGNLDLNGTLTNRIQGVNATDYGVRVRDFGNTEDLFRVQGDGFTYAKKYDVSAAEGYYQGGDLMLYSNSSDEVIRVGYLAGVLSNVTQQTALGRNAGYNSSGNGQIAVGRSAGLGNTADNQVTIGNFAGESNSGIFFTGLGPSAGRGNSGNYLVAVGSNAGRSNTADFLVALGLNSGYFNEGASVVAIGSNTARNNLGSSNVFIGTSAGYRLNNGVTVNTNSSQSLYLGSNTRSSALTTVNENVLGYAALGNGNNTFTFGNSSITRNYFHGAIQTKIQGTTIGHYGVRIRDFADTEDLFRVTGDGYTYTKLLNTGTITSVADLTTVTNVGEFQRIMLNDNGNTIINYQKSVWNGSTYTSTNTGLFLGRSAGFNNKAINVGLLAGYAAGQYNTGNYLGIAAGYRTARFNTGERIGAILGYETGQYNIGTYIGGIIGMNSAKFNTGSQIGLFGGYDSGAYNVGSNIGGAVGRNTLKWNTGASLGLVGGYFTGEYNIGANLGALIGSSAGRYNTGANNVIGHTSHSEFQEDTANAKTFDNTDIDTVNKTITITAHGFGTAGNYVNLKFTQGTSTITGLSDGQIIQCKVLDANTLIYSELLSSGQYRHTNNITNAGTGTGHTFTPQFKYTNVNILGNNVQPSQSNTNYIGNTSSEFNIFSGELYTQLKGTASTDFGVRVRDFADTEDVFSVTGDRVTKAISLQTIERADIKGAVYKSIRTVTTTQSVAEEDHTLEVTANTIALTLPDATLEAGRELVFKNRGLGVVTVDTVSAQTIDGNITRVLNTDEFIRVQSNGSNWIIISQ